MNGQPLEPSRSGADDLLFAQRVDLVIAQAEDARQHFVVVLAEHRRRTPERQELVIPTEGKTHVRRPTGNGVLHPLMELAHLVMRCVTDEVRVVEWSRGHTGGD